MPTNNSDTLVLLGNQSGWTLIPKGTPLTRLNYFDGKFLRAADLKAEQEYVRRLVHMSNEAGGPGVARGFDLQLEAGGDSLHVGPGLAIDPQGRVLFLSIPAAVDIQKLIEQSRDQTLVSNSGAKSANGNGFADCETKSLTPATQALLPNDLYLITIGHAEGYCGEEEVFGKLCEEACTTGTDRPYIIEGLVLRATPLLLKTLPAASKAVALTQKHRRSLVASAYFEDERNLVASLISGAGLKSDIWCFGAEGASGAEVPLGVIARSGKATLFLDAWTARRERIDPPAKRYWQWRMRMRPWDVFLAQILQFQCQLRDMFQTTPPPGGKDPCDDAHKLVAEASDALAEITKIYEAISAKLPQFSYGQEFGFAPYTGGVVGLNSLHQKLQAAKEAHLLAPTNRLLINGGIVELPSAGYLPVAPSETLSVNEQVALMMGEGVDLRFCVVRPDYVAHALEEAQHMERISLLEGLDDPARKPEVDVLVPDGLIIEEQTPARGGFEAELDVLPFVVTEVVNLILREIFRRATGDDNFQPITLDETVTFTGAARKEVLPGDGRAIRAAMLFEKIAAPSYLGDTSFGQAFGGTNDQATTAVTPNPPPPPPAAAQAVGNEAAEEKQPAAGADAQKKRLFKRMGRAAVKMGAARAPMNATAGAGDAAKATADKSADAEASEQGAAFSTREFALARSTQVSLEAGLWLTMSCDKDPAKLKAGQTLRVEGRFVAAGDTPSLRTYSSPQDLSAYFDGRLSADVLVTEATTAAGRNQIKCMVSAFGAVVAKLFDKETDASTINVNAEITWGPVAGGGQAAEIVVHISDDDSRDEDKQIRLSISWGGQPSETDALLKLVFQGFGETRDPVEITKKLIGTRFRPNPDVLKPGNANHEQAHKALQVIGSTLDDPSFYPTASGLLFPPPPAPTPGLVVRGTRDWVLFHRRRTKQCGAAEPAVVRPERKYRVFQLQLFGGTTSTLASGGTGGFPIPPSKEDILNASPRTIKRFRRVGDVSFGGGVATVAGDTTALKAGWQTVPDNLILWGGIGSHEEALGDGEALGKARGLAAAKVLDKVQLNTPVDILPIVPPWLDSAGVDGVIILISSVEPQTYYNRRAMKGIGDSNL